MKDSPVRKALRLELAVFVCVLLASLIGAILVMNLWNADPSIPFTYGGDELFSGTMVKTLLDNGWYLHNNFLGAPFSSDLNDFTQSNNLDFLIMKIISLATGDYAIVLNVYFLLTFPLIAGSSFLVMRKIGLSLPASAAGSLLFAFMPYHFLRGLPHLFLASYFMIPPLVLVVLWVFGDRPPFLKLIGQKKLSANVFDKKTLISIVICLLVSSTYIYYPVFSCMFLAVAGIVASVRNRSLYRLLPAIILIAIIIAGVLVNVSPSILFWLENGTNGQVGVRSPIEAEIYGLKIDQLLMPVLDHRVPQLAAIASQYSSHAPLVNENSLASLGIIGSLGFIFLIGWLIFGRRKWDRTVHADEIERLESLSILNISAVLLGTLGGFGAVVSMLIFSNIRCYNRISIFIAFFALVAIFTIADTGYGWLTKRSGGSGRKYMVVFSILIALVIMAGVYDQTSDSFVPTYDYNKIAYDSDRSLAQYIENDLPAGSMVFQLPYVAFPESPPQYNLPDYSHFRMYLNSEDIIWSYGAMKGRFGDLWQKEVSGMPGDQMLMNLSLAGFNGIYVDGNGYSDGGKSISDTISTAIGYGPSVIDDHNRYFFNMISYNDRLRTNNTPEQYDKLKELTLNPVMIGFDNGFYAMEGTAEANWRWCSQSGEMTINNPFDAPKKIAITMQVASGYPDKSNLTITDDDKTGVYQINQDPSAVEYVATVEPGRQVIKFYCEARRIYAPGDSRDLVFRVINLKYSEIE